MRARAVGTIFLAKAKAQTQEDTDSEMLEESDCTIAVSLLKHHLQRAVNKSPEGKVDPKTSNLA